ncbi:LEM domain-containing protein 2-like [Uloborus diversus]|uniref:LEM domain-containing protein 2-like n=1 Tax=Uloborus diversus TaxID=327109 RepID=UPI002409A2E9|nr:LEM domain-containing protein 2-like [Uloborus diversus]
MENGLSVEGFNIAELSDDELAYRLQSLGFIPGPILATTRAVYQRKLARLLNKEDFEDVTEEDVIPDAEITPDPSPPTNSSFQSYTSTPSSFNYEALRRRPLARVDGENWSERPPVLSPHRPWSADDIVTRAPTPPPVAEKPLSPALKITAVLVLLLFAFLVYYNMDSTPTNPFPSQDL